MAGHAFSSRVSGYRGIAIRCLLAEWLLKQVELGRLRLRWLHFLLARRGGSNQARISSGRNCWK